MEVSSEATLSPITAFTPRLSLCPPACVPLPIALSLSYLSAGMGRRHAKNSHSSPFFSYEEKQKLGQSPFSLPSLAQPATLTSSLSSLTDYGSKKVSLPPGSLLSPAGPAADILTSFSATYRRRVVPQV